LGLSPTINIWKISDNSLVIDQGSLISIGGGNYKYNFTTGIIAEDYTVRCDGTDTLQNADRYTYESFTFEKEKIIGFDVKTIQIEPNSTLNLSFAFLENSKLPFNKIIKAGIYDVVTKTLLEDVTLTYNYVTNSYRGVYSIPNEIEKRIQVIYREVDTNGIHYAVLDEGYIDSVDDVITAILLTDIEKSWTVNEWQNKFLYLEGQEITITSNIADSLSFTGNNVLTTDHDYFIYDYKCTILDIVNYIIDVIEDSDSGIF